MRRRQGTLNILISFCLIGMSLKVMDMRNAYNTLKDELDNEKVRFDELEKDLKNQEWLSIASTKLNCSAERLEKEISEKIHKFHRHSEILLEDKQLTVPNDILLKPQHVDVLRDFGNISANQKKS